MRKSLGPIQTRICFMTLCRLLSIWSWCRSTKNGLENKSQLWIWCRTALPGSEKTHCKVKFRAKADISGDKREEEAPIERTEARRTKTPSCFEEMEGRKVTGLRKASWEWAEVKDRVERRGTGMKKSDPVFEELQLCSCSLRWQRTFSHFLKGEKSCGLDWVSRTECQIKPELNSKSCALTRAQEPCQPNQVFFGKRYCMIFLW